jgi:cytochrome c-type biogenesis protein CcmH/NrfG
VSSLAAAPERAGQGAPAPPPEPVRVGRLTGDSLLGLGLAGALVAVGFLTSGNADPDVPVAAGYTWSQIAITLLGAAACAAIPVIGARGRAWGAGTVALFAAFTAFAAISITWSVQPDWAWYGANQLFCYLAAFAGAAALGRVFPERWPALIGGVAAAMAALSGYALLAKVFPATLASVNTYGRLQAPFGYWNAVGASAALGLPACVWAAARRSPGRVLRALTAPAMTLILSAIVLSYSRSALLVAVLGVGVWIAFVPLRLRAVAMLAVGAVGAIPIVVWALGNHSLTTDGIAPSAQDAAGHSFGLVLLAVLAVVAAAGFAVAIATDRVDVSSVVRRRIGTVLIVLVAMLPVVGLIGLAASSRGLTGQLSHAWHTFTTSQGVGDTSGRLTQLGSSRPMYWHQGLQVGDHALLKGAGELSYGIARLRYTTEPYKTDQAHSYLVQTFADLGLIGVAITLALLVAWGVAAARPLALRTSWRSLTSGQSSERQGLVALAAIAVAFGVQSALDWTWFFPGLTVPALLCAGWLVGRGPLSAPVGRANQRVALRRRPGAGAAVTAVAAIALIGAWVLWQPLRSADDVRAAENSTTNSAAFADARAAVGANPLSIEPLNILSSLYQGIHDGASARAELVKATRLQPDNPEPWVWLGSYALQTGDARGALNAMSRVLALDHTQDPDTVTALAAITRAKAVLATRGSSL